MKCTSKNYLELIIENIKLARKTILKMEKEERPDDYFTKEFMIKYQKEIQKLLMYFIEQRKKEKNNTKKAIMNIGKNINFIRISDILLRGMV